MGQHGAVQCRRCGAAIRLVSESGLTSGIDVGWPAAFAGKPAPTGFGVSHHYRLTISRQRYLFTRLQNQVERRFRRPPERLEARLGKDLAQPRLARLGTEAEPDFLGQ